MKTIIVIPAYNEAKYIGKFLDKLLARVPASRVVVVDDGSRDKTAQIAKEKGVTTLIHLTNLGKGAALKTGCDYTFKKMGASAVIIMDGDDQHEVTDLKLFEKELRAGKEIVLGVRKMDAKIPLFRLLGNKSLSIIINLLFKTYIADIPSGFKAFTKRVYKQIHWDSSGYEVETEIAVRLAKKRIPFTEVPISTIYMGKEHGFNYIDACGILMKIPLWIWR